MVRSFPSATTQCMNDYVKPSIRAQTDHFILHVGTNDMISDSTPTEVARKVFDRAGRLKSDTCDVTISELIIIIIIIIIIIRMTRIIIRMGNSDLG